MKVSEGVAGWDLDAAPDRRLDVPKLNLELEYPLSSVHGM
jgi:hypothetical protein